MARPLRIEYPDAWYHVTCRGNEQREIFREDEDRTRLLDILAQALQLYSVELHSYVLMSNHFHLILRTREANLHSFMQRFNTSYTVYFNKKYQRSGHLYQGRYKAILIEADNYLLELSRYVHLNPIRIKKLSQLSVEKKREIIKRHTWSSYPGYIHLHKRQGFVAYQFVLRMFAGGDTGGGRKQYERFVRDGIVKDMDIRFWEGVRGQAVLGSDVFIEKVYSRYLRNRKRDRREQPGLEELCISPVTIEDIATLIAKEYDVSVGNLYQRRSQNAEARSMLIELCHLYMTRKMSMREIGERLGGISISGISQNSRRLKEKIKRDKRLQKRFHALVERINEDIGK